MSERANLRKIPLSQRERPPQDATPQLQRVQKLIDKWSRVETPQPCVACGDPSTWISPGGRPWHPGCRTFKAQDEVLGREARSRKKEPTSAPVPEEDLSCNSEDEA